MSRLTLLEALHFILRTHQVTYIELMELHMGQTGLKVWDL